MPPLLTQAPRAPHAGHQPGVSRHRKHPVVVGCHQGGYGVVAEGAAAGARQAAVGGRPRVCDCTSASYRSSAPPRATGCSLGLVSGDRGDRGTRVGRRPAAATAASSRLTAAAPSCRQGQRHHAQVDEDGGPGGGARRGGGATTLPRSPATPPPLPGRCLGARNVCGCAASAYCPAGPWAHEQIPPCLPPSPSAPPHPPHPPTPVAAANDALLAAALRPKTATASAAQQATAGFA